MAPTRVRCKSVKEHYYLAQDMIHFLYQMVNILWQDILTIRENFDTIIESIHHTDGGRMATIGARIKTIRQKKSWSQRELARVAGVRQATVAELETGMRTETRTDILRRLAKALGVTADWLIGMYDADEDDDNTPALVSRRQKRRAMICRA